MIYADTDGVTFDRTYEGLKLGSPVDWNSLTAPFDRTYEGLKRLPRPGEPRAGPHQLLTVPMRV